MVEMLKLILDFGNTNGGYAAIAVLLICIIAAGAYFVGQSLNGVLCYCGEKWVTPLIDSTRTFLEAQGQCMRVIADQHSKMVDAVGDIKHEQREVHNKVDAIRETQIVHAEHVKLLPSIHINTATCGKRDNPK